MIGRNDICPCGSGKKYKKCCLHKSQVSEFTKNKVIYAKGLYKNLENKMAEYSNQAYFKKDKDECKKYFLVNRNENEQINKFFKTYFIHDYVTKNNKTVATMFVEVNKNYLSKSNQNIIMGMLNSYMGIFNVKSISATGAVVIDNLTEEERKIDDIDAFKNINVGDNIIGRLINVQDMVVFMDFTIRVSQKNNINLINHIKEMYKTNMATLNNIKEFISYNSQLLYKFAQEIIINGYECEIKLSLEESKSEDIVYDKIEEIKKENESSIYDLLKNNIEEKYLDKGIELWNEFLKDRDSITGNENGWAAAIEYYIKKNEGENITQVQISQKYEVSPRTLGKRYKELRVS